MKPIPKAVSHNWLRRADFLLRLCGLLALALGLAMALPGRAAPQAPALVEKARAQVGVTTSYDPAYRTLAYPGGDVDPATGVCSDVVVRAFRGVQIDLQEAVHEDMTQAFKEYPQKWGLKRPDRNIDHRRVPNLMTYFRRKGWALPVTRKASDYRAGDVVAWELPGSLTHIGIVSDRRSDDGVPLILHNIGRGTVEEDLLFSYKIIGHYRPRLESPELSRKGGKG